MQNYLMINETNSTNDYAFKLLHEQKTINNYFIVCSKIQTKGKGIYNNSWHSEEYKNLTFSIIYFPKKLEIKYFFLLSMTISLGIYDYLKNYKINPEIKWPNDIIVNNKKICGILIENNIKNNEVLSSIIGIGLNINQTDFPDVIKNPVSLKNITKKSYNIEKELKKISPYLINRLKSISETNFENIKNEYISKLFNYNVEKMYKTKFGIINASIIDVNYDGSIILLDRDKKEKKFYFKEIEFLYRNE